MEIITNGYECGLDCPYRNNQENDDIQCLKYDEQVGIKCPNDRFWCDLIMKDFQETCEKCPYKNTVVVVRCQECIKYLP